MTSDQNTRNEIARMAGCACPTCMTNLWGLTAHALWVSAGKPKEGVDLTGIVAADGIRLPFPPMYANSSVTTADGHLILMGIRDSPELATSAAREAADLRRHKQ